MSFTYTISGNDWGHVTPILSLLLVALLVMIIDIFLPARQRGLLVIVALLGVASSAASTLVLYQQSDSPDAFAGMIASDHLTLFASLVILTATGLSLILSPGYIERQGIRQQGEFYALVLLAATGMLLLAAATNLMTIFLGIELLSLPLYVLCAFAPGQQRAHEAGMKYFLLSSFASGFLLYGMALTYGATGATNLSEIQRFITTHHVSFSDGFGPLLVAGMGLLAVGLAFKVSAIPFHAWTPDVYQGAPTSVTALMSVGTKTAAFIALIRLFDITFVSLVNEWQGILWALAVLTMIGGNLMAATQTNVKRLLSYSSIAHAGYILIGVSLGTRLGISATLFYLAAYSMMNIGAFGVVLALERVAGLGTELADYNGLGARRPLLAAMLSVFLFALAGIPGTVGFIGKYTVFAAASAAGHAELTIIAIIASMIGFYYYLRIIWTMYFLAPATAVSDDPNESAIKLGAMNTVSTISGTGLATLAASKVMATTRPIAAGAMIGLVIALIGTIALGIVPDPLVVLARQAAGLP